MSSTFRIPKRSLAREVKALMAAQDQLPLTERTAFDFEAQLRRILLKYEVAVNFTVHITEDSRALDVIPATIKDDLIIDGISSKIFQLSDNE